MLHNSFDLLCFQVDAHEVMKYVVTLIWYIFPKSRGRKILTFPVGFTK